MKGSLVISLDFELMWGLIDNKTPDNYGRTNVMNVKYIIPKLIDMFNKYQVKATVATVGLIMLNNKEEALKYTPSKKPSYINKKLSPYYNNYIENISSINYDMYFNPSLVEILKSSKIIEIASHTFCHYYCYAKGQNITEFEEDLKQSINISKQNGITIKSIIFPRNQVDKDYLTVCKKYGIESYRGNPLNFYGKKQTVIGKIANKIGRLIDCYFKIGDRTSYSYDKIECVEGLINIKASRFLRPYNKFLSLFESLRIRRIKKEIEYAAKHDEIYHLWWHPHNFGNNMDDNFHNLEKILKCYKKCHQIYNMESHTMSEITALVKSRNPKL